MVSQHDPNPLLPRSLEAGAHGGETEALKIESSEIKAWLESVQDEEDPENSTADKIRRVMSAL
jgi:hypothetical protein